MNVEDFIGDFNDSGSELEEDTGSISPASACSTSELESESEGPRRLNFSQRSLPLHSFNGKDVNRTKKRKKEVTTMPMKVARAEKENERPIGSISDQLCTTNSLLKSLVKRLDKHEKRLSEVEQKICRSTDISSSSTTTPVRRQKVVPPEVRVSGA